MSKPSITAPKRRPFALRRFQVGRIEKAPAGCPTSTEGFRIWTPMLWNDGGGSGELEWVSRPAASISKPSGRSKPVVRPRGASRMQMSIRPGSQASARALERRLRSVDPDVVDVGDEDGVVAQVRQGPGDAAAGIQEARPLVRDEDPWRAATRQMRLHLVGEVVDVDHGGLDADGLEAVEHVVDERPPGHLDQRLGLAVRERPHAGAEPCGEHHGRLRRLLGRAQARAPGGTLRSNQAFRPSIPGPARLRSR